MSLLKRVNPYKSVYITASRILHVVYSFVLRYSHTEKIFQIVKLCEGEHTVFHNQKFTNLTNPEVFFSGMVMVFPFFT